MLSISSPSEFIPITTGWELNFLPLCENFRPMDKSEWFFFLDINIEFKILFNFFLVVYNIKTRERS